MSKYKYSFFLIILGLCFNSFAWEESTFSEDSESQFWTGISSPRKDLNEASKEAYDNAINEAIKYNFGFTQKVSESFYQSTDNKDLYKENHVETPSVQIKNALPINQKVKELKSGYFIVFRQIKYNKKEISLEKERLNSLTKDIKPTNDYNLIIESNQSNKLGKLVIRTHPDNAQIKLTPVEKFKGNKEYYLSSNNTEFIVPFGQYILDVSKTGYKFVNRKILLSGEEQSLIIPLEEEDSFLDITTVPSDAEIFINDKKLVQSKKVKVTPNKIYSIKIKHPLYLTESFSIQPLSGDYKIIEKKLKPKNSSFRIISEPSDAKVFANGKEIGSTPIMNFISNQENIEIVLIKKGFKPQSKLIQGIKANSDNEAINFILERQ